MNLLALVVLQLRQGEVERVMHYFITHTAAVHSVKRAETKECPRCDVKQR